MAWSEENDRFCVDFIDGYQKVVAKKKEDGVMSMQEGKSHLTWNGYIRICSALIKDENEIARRQGISLAGPTTNQRTVRRGRASWMSNMFAHSFETLSWNLMARSKSVAALHYSHMQWQGDCLSVKYARTKKDRTGKQSKMDRHIYAK